MQAVMLGVLATTGLIAASRSAAGVTTIAGFELNPPHSVLLLGTAVLSALAVVWSRMSRAWAVVQAIGFTLLFLIGSASSAGSPQDTWLALNGPDNFLHLGLAVAGGVLGTVLLIQPAAIPIPQEKRPDQRPSDGDDESAEQDRDMVDAEVAVAEGHATPEQARRVEEDAQRRSDAEHRRAWQQYRRSRDG
ncbi:MAG TPA: DUF4383 domain-containing protein [Pseudonocardiaceae bacterium]|nr:DUF4383 domain-containing protein [Pseudonocardiaceae bacterium]